MTLWRLRGHQLSDTMERQGPDSNSGIGVTLIR